MFGRVSAAGEGGRRQASRMRVVQALSRAYAKRLEPAHVELVVSQELLVPLWRQGVLGGRAFDVWMAELPASMLQQRLDAAANLTPGAPSLRDLRMDAAWLADEWAALHAARSRATAHADIHQVLRQAGLTCELHPWVQPSSTAGARGRMRPWWFWPAAHWREKVRTKWQPLRVNWG